jgi:NAD dependent epimerase/dehydratase
VFHLSSLIAIPYSYVAPHSYVETNVTGALNLMEACRDAGVSRVVHTSTSEVYGSARYVPIDEAHPLQGQSPYSASKIGADMMAQSYHRSFELPVVTVRPFNTFGPRQSARAVIPTILSQLLSGRTQIRLGALAPTRDFNFVDDIVEGFLLAARCDRAVGEVVQLGTGAEVSIGDLVRLAADVAGCSVEVSEEQQRVRPAGSEVDRLCCDASRAREWMGWVPKVDLREGLARTASWMRQHLDLYKADVYNV